MPTAMPMSLEKNKRRVKRRKVDCDELADGSHHATSPGARTSPNDQRQRDRRTCSPSRPRVKIVPVIRPPEAPFAPNAIRVWVARDGAGKKYLVSEMVPGCRHWRMGDPNVSFCFECKKEGTVGEDGLFGCRTCKRSYHVSCLPGKADDYMKRGRFYCPPCLDRGFHLQPPPEILPLTPSPSTEGTPEPEINDSTSTPEPRVQEGKKQSRGIDSDLDEVLTDTKSPAGPVFSNQLSPDTGSSSVVQNSALASPVVSGSRPHQPVPSCELHKPNCVDKAPMANKAVVKKKSRYQTMTDEVDQAITTIYRELESVAELRIEIKLLQDQMKAIDQARQISEGRLALERSGRDEAFSRRDAEIDSLKRQLEAITRAHDSLLQENNVLKQRAQEEESSTQAKLEEIRTLKASLRRWLDD